MAGTLSYLFRAGDPARLGRMNSSVAGNASEKGFEMAGRAEVELAGHEEGPVQERFRLREGCQFFAYDGSSDKEEFIVCTPEKRQFRISKVVKETLEKFDGRTSFDEIVRSLEELSAEVSLPEFCDLLTKRYVSLGILETTSLRADNGVENTRAAKAKTSFFLHWSLIPQHH